MRKMFGFLVMAAFLLVGLVGCGEDKTVYIQSQQEPVQTPAQTQKSTLTFNSAKSLTLQFALDESGNLKNLRDGGVRVKPADVDYVVLSSYRFGDYKNSPFKATLDSSLRAVFSALPNNDQWMECWVVLTSGKKYLAELSQFEAQELEGMYDWVDPAESSLEYGDIEDPSAQDWMRMSLDTATMTATLKGQFGCDLIFATKAGAFSFQPGMKMGVEDGNGNLYTGDIVEISNNNLSWRVSGIPVVAGPYYSPDGITPAPVATTIKDIFVLMPDGVTKISLNLRLNTANNDDSTYVWYIDTYTENASGEFWVSQYEGPATINYWP